MENKIFLEIFYVKKNTTNFIFLIFKIIYIYLFIYLFIIILIKKLNKK